MHSFHVLTCLQGFFDEGTRNKLSVLGSNPGPDLLKHINAEDLPKVYGGLIVAEPVNRPLTHASNKVVR